MVKIKQNGKLTSALVNERQDLIKWTKSHYDRYNRVLDVDLEGKLKPMKPIKMKESELLALEN